MSKFSGKTSAICRLSDHVIVGNSYLAEYAKQFNQNVTIVPSGVDTVKFIPHKRKRDGNKIIVGWTGSSTSQTHLEMFSPMLKAVFANQGEIELHISSDREPVLPEIPFVWHRWTTENEVEVLSTFDIGIMPIPDDKWSRGKCAMKALLYMSLGIPTICSNVGANRDVISNGLNGLLSTSTEDWVNAVKSLVNDRKLRRLGDAGRQTIEERFRPSNVHLCLPKLSLIHLPAVPRKRHLALKSVSFNTDDRSSFFDIQI
ncbi:MAG: glycosyltransferase family 4 protein [Acidobacteria bacterium]|nr:glycosyltransferase family 4 protein [Acidobacteriota bacterium]